MHFNVCDLIHLSDPSLCHLLFESTVLAHTSVASVLFLGSTFYFNYERSVFYLQDTPDPYEGEEVISLPIYFDITRERIVCRLDVPCGGNISQWLQCGAALFLRSQ